MKKATFAERLKEAIEQSDLNQSELADRIGIHRSTITHYLTGRYEPRHDRVDQFARILNVSPIWLMGFDVPMQRHADDTMPEINEQIGARIRSERKNQSMTLIELADKVGLSEGTVQRYEIGSIGNISIAMIEKFANALKTTPSFLMGWDTPYGVTAISGNRDEKNEHGTPDIQERLQELMSQISPDAGLAFLNGDEPMDDETKELMYESLKNALRLSKLLAERNKEK